MDINFFKVICDVPYKYKCLDNSYNTDNENIYLFIKKINYLTKQLKNHWWKYYSIASKFGMHKYYYSS